MADANPIPICTAHLGARAEMIASSWLLGLGYEVFRNVSSAGPADIMIWHPVINEHHLIDVKWSASESVSAHGFKQAVSRNPGHADVHILYVNKTDVVGFFKRETDRFIPYRYWPLGVAMPSLPDGYNESPSLPRLASWKRYISFNGVDVPAQELAKKAGITTDCLFARLKNGYSLDEALGTPLRGKRRAPAHETGLR